MDKTKIKEGFILDAGYRLSDKVMDTLLDSLEEKQFKKGEQVLEPDSLSSDLYVLFDGICRVGYYYGDKETTYGFATTGTIFLSPLAYKKRTGGLFFHEACTNLRVGVLPAAKFNELLKENNEFCHWMFSTAMEQLAVIEFKLKEFQLTPKERYNELILRADLEKYKNFLFNHPDIVSCVPDKVLASYLNIIPTHLSRIKKQIVEEERAQRRLSKN